MELPPGPSFSVHPNGANIAFLLWTFHKQSFTDQSGPVPIHSSDYEDSDAIHRGVARPLPSVSSCMLSTN